MNLKVFIDTYIKDMCYSNLSTSSRCKESALVFYTTIVIPCEYYSFVRQQKLYKKLKSFTNIHLRRFTKDEDDIVFDITIRSKTNKHENDLYSPTIATEVLMLKNYKTLYKYIKTILDYYLVDYNKDEFDNEFNDIIAELSRLKA